MEQTGHMPQGQAPFAYLFPQACQRRFKLVFRFLIITAQERPTGSNFLILAPGLLDQTPQAVQSPACRVDI